MLRLNLRDVNEYMHLCVNAGDNAPTPETLFMNQKTWSNSNPATRKQLSLYNAVQGNRVIAGIVVVASAIFTIIGATTSSAGVLFIAVPLLYLSGNAQLFYKNLSNVIEAPTKVIINPTGIDKKALFQTLRTNTLGFDWAVKQAVLLITTEPKTLNEIELLEGKLNPQEIQ